MVLLNKRKITVFLRVVFSVLPKIRQKSIFSGFDVRKSIGYSFGILTVIRDFLNRACMPDCCGQASLAAQSYLPGYAVRQAGFTLICK